MLGGFRIEDPVLGLPASALRHHHVRKLGLPELTLVAHVHDGDRIVPNRHTARRRRPLRLQSVRFRLDQRMRRGMLVARLPALTGADVAIVAGRRDDPVRPADRRKVHVHRVQAARQTCADRGIGGRQGRRR